ncbi:MULTISPECIES: endo alpha-1,4 polygalactosaminidase [unclassified Streptomyces]|uniref:endo alpha-1,4 polygalactosaminidase n=1 Tax=unclassified Streptomyces TaxID=2593676 RepID=UPI0022526F51|nr:MULTISPECIES: endo alpha-1,4 polygalactosaminidase [unclassified Streptomyces]MCX5139783.1 endo alpha-1,4 polygalactosaminidase [Streptomyces sp. NBC_00338]WRZ64436.1 endo alpha-1,4 polygalactosaminidase [Streptomyces sp. NBC_01257]WSU58399.1 endo alpha-1,4 polygalactosaminidase [Streptomyces sp. NBC_01104]
MHDRVATHGTGRPPAVSVAVLILLVMLAGCTSAPRPAPPPAPSGPSAGARWQPAPGTDWQWQLSGRLDTTVDAPVYDIDGFDHAADQVAALHRKGRKVICYLSTGAWEEFRPDAARFPTAVLGKGNGWKGERWLDIRRTDVLEPLMESRIAMCAKKGFDAVEPDNMDGYRNRTGFPLTAADQLRYNRLVARIAHRHHLAVGLKNDLPQIPELVGDFDFAVNEQCAQYEECAELSPFVKAGKAVFHVEYELPVARFCAQSRRLGLSSLLKKYELGVWRERCPAAGA